MFKYFTSSKRKTKRLLKQSKENAEKIIKKFTARTRSTDDHSSEFQNKAVIPAKIKKVV